MKTICLIFLCSASVVSAQWTDAYIPDFKVNDDNLNSQQYGSSIGVDSAGNFVIVWNDSRMWPGSSYPWQVYCQRFTKDGNPIGSNFRIGQDTAVIPTLTVLKEGRFVVTWTWNFQNYILYEMYYQRFSSNGQPLGIPRRIIDKTFNTTDGGIQGKHIAADTSGNFIICWSKKPPGAQFHNVYFQRYDSSGNRIGTAEIVNEVPRRAEYPDIAVNRDGSFVICWQDDRHTPVVPVRYDIFVQRYNSNGIKIGNNLKVNDDNDSTFNQVFSSISSDGRGNLVITWTDNRVNPPYASIFYQVYDSTGSTMGGNRRADVNPSWSGIGISRAAMRTDKKFFIGWTDDTYAGREQFYRKRFDSLGNPIGNPYMIPMSSPGTSTQRGDAVFILGDRVHSTWTDNRNGGSVNYDIYCNVRGFQNPDTVIGIKTGNEFVKEFRLYPAYPNPFNTKTVIRYQLSVNSFLSLTVYDLLGREVAVLVNGKKKPGQYEVIFDGENLTSGVYFHL